MLTEKKAIYSTIGVIIFLVSLPSIFGYIVTPPGYTYTGIRSFVPGDVFVYYSYIEQMRQGNVWLTDLYTTETGTDFINIFWQSVGVFARIGDFSPGMVFFWLRIILGTLFLFFIYRVIVFFTTDVHQKSYIPQFLFTIFSGGVGLYYLLLHFDATELNTPMDVWVPEHNFIITLITSPHFIVSTILIIGALIAGMIAISRERIGYAVLSGSISLILFQFHPYFAPLVLSIIGAFFLISALRQRELAIKQGFLYVGTIVLLSLPSIVYHLYLLKTDEIFLARASKNILPLPDAHIFFISFGIYLPLAAVGIYKLYKQKTLTDKQIFLLTWFFVQLAIFLLPITYQRKLLEAWILPVSILAWDGLQYIRAMLLQTRWKSYASPVVVTILIIIFSPSSYFNLVRDYTILNNNDSGAYYYGLVRISPDAARAYQWLENHTNADEPILSHINSGLLIPAYSGRRVYIGHWSETVYVEEVKLPMLKVFFSKETDDVWRKRFLQNNNLQYLWWGIQEKRNFDFNPSEKGYLMPVFTSPDVTIYWVRLD